MRRRNFIGALIAGAVVAPLAARAQQPMPVIGWLGGQSAELYRDFLAGFHRGLGETSFVEGRNVAMEFRWADGDLARLPAFAAELVARNVDLIVAGGGDGPQSAAKAATSAIPIVATFGKDPVQSGLIAGFARPGGNMTGVALLTTEMNVKGLELLHELVPSAASVAVLLNPRIESYDTYVKAIEAADRALGTRATIYPVRTDAEVETAFARMAERGHGGLLVGSGLFPSSRKSVVALATRHRIPTVYFGRFYPDLSGLFGFGTDIIDVYRKLGVLAGRILKGEKPADIPVEQPTTFEFVVNLKAAQALGIAIPPAILVRAYEVIE